MDRCPECGHRAVAWDARCKHYLCYADGCSFSSETLVGGAVDIGERTIEALKRLNEQLESGEPIPCTIVTVEHTPDGPLTMRREGFLFEDGGV